MVNNDFEKGDKLANNLPALVAFGLLFIMAGFAFLAHYFGWGQDSKNQTGQNEKPAVVVPLNDSDSGSN